MVEIRSAVILADELAERCDWGGDSAALLQRLWTAGREALACQGTEAVRWIAEEVIHATGRWAGAGTGYA